MTQQEAWVALNAVSGLGTTRINALLGHFKSAEAVFNADGQELSALGLLPPAVIANIRHFSKEDFLKHEYNLMRQKKVEVITVDDNRYPEALREIPGAPLVLYVRGNVEALSTVSIGMVGARAASFYGQKVSGDFAYTLGLAGISVVSGLARGIDTAAHRGCLKDKGTTIAVLGCGLNYIYPKENTLLCEEIINQGGAIVSELPMEIAPAPRNFPPRNRIISGLSQALVLVEAGEKSGSLITVDYALEQGRDVFVVPGPVAHASCLGSNRLIKDGAKLALNVGDVLESLGLEACNELEMADLEGKNKIRLSESEFEGFKILGSQPVHIEQVMAQLHWGLPQAMEVMLNLELKQAVRQLPGQYYVKV